MRKTLLILISATLLLAGQATAIDLNSSRALQYYGAATTDGNLDFQVSTDGTVDVYGSELRIDSSGGEEASPGLFIQDPSTTGNYGAKLAYNDRNSNNELALYLEDSGILTKGLTIDRSTANVEIPNGNLDMNGNNITDCNYINGVDCSNLGGGGGSGTDDQNLSEVLADGNVANQTIEFSNGIEIGDSSTTVGSNTDAVAVGKAADASDLYASAFGSDASASGTSASAFGGFASASGRYASAVGYVANASGDQASAVGFLASATNDYASAFGRSADATAEGAVAIGHYAYAPNQYEATFGNLGNQYYGGPLDVNVTGNATVHGSLSVGGTECPDDEALLGDGTCGSTGGSGSTQNLKQVLTAGNVANQTIDMSGNNITNVAEPDSPQDAATKKYVDTLIYGEGVNRTIFVTNSSYASDLGGPSGADNKCQTEANNAGMSGSYKAVLSTGSVDAMDRFDWAWHDRIVNPAGEVVARNDYKLWKKGSEGVKPGETLATPIQTGAQSGTDRVWTGTKSNGERATGGTPTHHCSGWTNGDLEDDAYIGNATATNNEWIANGEYEDCRSYSYARLYCLETK